MSDLLLDNIIMVLDTDLFVFFWKLADACCGMLMGMFFVGSCWTRV